MQIRQRRPATATRKNHGLLSGQTFQLQMPVELAHDLGIVTPIAQDFHVQFQKNLRAKNFLEFLARFGANFL